MIWPFNRKEPEPKPEAEDGRSETIRARQKKQNALADLMAALSTIDVDGDLDHALSRKPKR